MFYVAAIGYYNVNTLATGTYYAGSVGFTTKPSDTPANTLVAPTLKNPALIRRDIFDIGTVGGASRVGYGELVLVNVDGALDVFQHYAVDGRTQTIYVSDSLTAAFPSGWTVLLTGTMEQAELSLSTLRIRCRDRQVFATEPFQTFKYGGTNVLPAGVDGLTTDLKGKEKPRTLGAPLNVEPVWVNTSLLIGQVQDGTNHGAMRDIMAVYDSGAILTSATAVGYTDYTSQAAMEATAPPPGYYSVWKAGGMFRLGSSPVGQVTCDVIQGIDPAARTAAQMAKGIFTSLGLTVNATDITTLDAASSATLSIYVKEERTNQQVLDDIARSVGAWWGQDNSGAMRIQRLEAPTGSPVVTLTEDEITGIARVPLNDLGLPTYSTTVRGVPNYTVQTTGLAAAVTADRRARLAQPYQDVTVTDTAVQTAYPLAPELIVETKLACLTAVGTEATRLQALYGVKRDRFEVSAVLTAAQMGLIDLGVVVHVTHSRFELSGGKLFRVIGYQIDPTLTSAVTTLTLWG